MALHKIAMCLCYLRVTLTLCKYSRKCIYVSYVSNFLYIIECDVT